MHEFKETSHVEEKAGHATHFFFTNSIIFDITIAKCPIKTNDASKPFGLKASFVYTLKPSVETDGLFFICVLLRNSSCQSRFFNAGSFFYMSDGAMPVAVAEVDDDAERQPYRITDPGFNRQAVDKVGAA